MECKKEANKEKCACPNGDCDNHGICCDCVRAHREAGGLPMCLRDLATKE